MIVLMDHNGFFVFDFALTLCSPGMQGQTLVAVHPLLTLGIHSSLPRSAMFAALRAAWVGRSGRPGPIFSPRCARSGSAGRAVPTR